MTTMLGRPADATAAPPGVSPGVPYRRPGRLAVALIGTGLAVLVVGSFLPWLRSGSTERMSYAADGLLRSVASLDAVSHAVLLAWPMLPLLCASSLGLLMTRWRAAAAVLSGSTAVLAAYGCASVLLLHSSSLVAVTVIGPAVTLTGAALTLAGVTALSLRSVYSVRSAAASRRFRRLG